MTTLTKSDKEQIKKQILKHRFFEEYIELVKKFINFTNEVYEDIFKEIKDKMYDLPEGWLPEITSFEVKFGSEYTRLKTYGYPPYNCGGEFRSFELPAELMERKSLRIIDKKCSTCLKDYSALNPLSVKFFFLLEEKSNLQSLVQKAENQIEAAFSQTRSLNTLKKLWPEISTFLEPYEKEKRNFNPPVIAREKLNQSLNLPPE